MSLKLQKNEKIQKIIRNAKSLSGRNIVVMYIILNTLTGRTRSVALIEM